MKLARRHLIAFGLFLAAACIGLVTELVSSSQADDYTSTVVSNVLPGSAVRITFDGSEQWNGSDVQDLSIVLPPGDTPPPDPTEAKFYFADRAWRAEMAAADIAMQNPGLASWDISSQGSVPSGAEDFYNGRVRVDPGDENWADLPDLGTLSTADASSQIVSNAGVLKNSAPAGTFNSVAASRLTIDSGINSYAYTVTVNSDLPPAQLLPQFGNIFDGLQAGLVGDENGLIDGLAIIVRSQGEPIAGSWIAERAGVGDEIFAQGLDLPDPMVPTDSFPNLTGGPAVTGSGTSNPGVE
jgi:hypothetical protein